MRGAERPGARAIRSDLDQAGARQVDVVRSRECERQRPVRIAQVRRPEHHSASSQLEDAIAVVERTLEDEQIRRLECCTDHTSSPAASEEA